LQSLCITGTSLASPMIDAATITVPGVRAAIELGAQPRVRRTGVENASAVRACPAPSAAARRGPQAFFLFRLLLRRRRSNVFLHTSPPRVNGEITRHGTRKPRPIGPLKPPASAESFTNSSPGVPGGAVGGGT